MSNELFQLSDRVRILPVIHGSGHFMRVVRQQILSEPCDCVAVSLPSEFQTSVEEGIDLLPCITLSAMEEPGGAYNYITIDPAQPIIMALRIAKQEGITSAFIDWSSPTYETRHHIFPDAFALSKMPYEKFCVSILASIPYPKLKGLHDRRSRWIGYQLHKLEMDYRNIVLICSFLDWPWVKHAFDERQDYETVKSVNSPKLYSLEEKNLFFALSEMPYITYLYEKKRQELKSDRLTPVDGVKEILIRARELFLKKYNP